jgi:predicted GH43/DUF377 family glycosyl hydrolase
MKTISVRRHDVSLEPDSRRVIIRPFIPSNSARIVATAHRALALSEAEAEREWKQICGEFADRHIGFEEAIMAHFEQVQDYLDTTESLSRVRRLLVGSLFSGEYALESAALFNPSIVAHPDQTEVPEGALRFILSLRATGEGHISSIEFRSGIIDASGAVKMDPVSRFVSTPTVVPNPTYHKKNFVTKLRESDLVTPHAEAVMASLSERFTRTELDHSVSQVRSAMADPEPLHQPTFECLEWLAGSNYELSFKEESAMSERAIFPVSANESNGIEDARFVRFVGDAGEVLYGATYTAYNGRAILPQLIETKDFIHFRVLAMTGSAVRNKGMALFPRKVGGRYAMLSRQDDENILIMFSDDHHEWNDAQVLMRPEKLWEGMKIGNCGSPIETEAGWLVITHGAGPMRKYCIGAALLDLDDPTRVIGRLRSPLLMAEGAEREGYVPNVVYSCGALLHGENLILPYAVSDSSSAIATVRIDELLRALVADSA